MKKPKFKKLSTYSLITSANVKDELFKLRDSFPDVFDIILPNLTASTIKSNLDLFGIFIEAIESMGYNISTIEDDILISKEIYSINTAFGIQANNVMKAPASHKKSFVLTVLGIMAKELHCPSPGDYVDQTHERMENYYEEMKDYGEDNELEWNLDDLETCRTDLESFDEIIKANGSGGIKRLYELIFKIKDNELYYRVMKILEDINGYAITRFVLWDEDNEWGEFTHAFRLEYDFECLITQDQIQETDDVLNNTMGIGEPSIVFRSGEEEPTDTPDFQLYVDLYETLYKIIEDEFD